ncbi:hypothetical protein KAZ66_01395 [Candidatus Woesebacteria bacterium]|nr:hypothetical protein [Candidatus Woesebacteria bacterium]
MGIKDRRTKILLSLLLMSNDQFRFVSFDKTTLFVFDLTLNRKTLSTLQKLEKEGYIEGQDDNKSNEAPSYRLTDAGFKSIALNFPVFRFTREKWDQVFRILSYEIPEKKRELRDKLRREVASWGLGPWHRSFWLTPHPIIPSLKELVSKKAEEQYIQAFESKHAFGDTDILIEKVWGRSKLENTYRKLFKKWHEILSKDQEKDKKMAIVVNNYIEVLKTDPGLPKELLGDKWIGYEAINLFREIRNILLGTK